MRTIQQTIQEAIDFGWMPQDFISWSAHFEQARLDAWEVLKYVTRNENPVWLSEYNQIIQWFCAPNGKGICLLGQCGLGKTLFAMHILPTLILHYTKKVAFVCKAVDLKDEIDKIVTGNHRLIVVDDVGTESVESNHYGNKSAPFAELMDYVERKRAVLIITSNLSGEKLLERYETRTYERILGCMADVTINGKSMRG